MFALLMADEVLVVSALLLAAEVLLVVTDGPLICVVVLLVEWKLFARLWQVLPKGDVALVRNPSRVGNPLECSLH
jgi:hypothetical protein